MTGPQPLRLKPPTKSKKLKPPEFTPAAIAAHPAPDRARYFCGADYAAACMRTHDRRMKYDRLRK